MMYMGTIFFYLTPAIRSHHRSFDQLLLTKRKPILRGGVKEKYEVFNLYRFAVISYQHWKKPNDQRENTTATLSKEKY